ncbi:MAG: NAD(P)H-dependent oxidoreductase [Bacteroidales bacterium]|jgi:multimeric flavodoxin WrbA/putative sterol carrier protein|nr:NAD(P)H-dependent oxidoreductase [Bacteroidales bacterium]
MKEILSPLAIMQNMVEKLQNFYPEHPEKAEGIIQFHFTHANKRYDCYIQADQHKLKLYQGTAQNPTVSVQSSFYSWLDLAFGRLHPFIGMITRKLKFKGDVRFFRVIPKKSLKNSLWVPADPVTRFEKNPSKYWEKPEKIVVLNASPRGKNGYTDFYLKPFLKGLRKKAEVTQHYLNQYKVKPCIGCFSCWINKPGECIYHHEDNFHDLAEKFADADMIVYAFPIYADNIPGVLKNYFDRSVSRAYPYMIEGMNGVRHPRKYIHKNQSMVVFSICGFWEMKNFIPAKTFFKALAHNRHCPVVGEIYRTTAIGLYDNPFLFKKLNLILGALEKAGEELINSGKIKRSTYKLIHQKLKRSPNDLDRINEWWNKKKGSKEFDY